MLKTALALAFAAVPAAAQPAAPGIIGMSLMEALVKVERPELAGVFAYVPEGQSAVAMADFLLRDPDALKRYIKKTERDRKAAGAIGQWDKEVFLHLVAATAGGGAPPGLKPPGKKLVDGISRLALSPAVPFDELLRRRAGAGG